MKIELTDEEVSYIRGILIATRSCKFTKNIDGKMVKKLLDKFNI